MGKITQETRHESYIKVDKRTRQETILKAFRDNGGMTAKNCMKYLGFTDLNQCRPRICELVELGKLVETGKDFDFETNRTVAIFGIPTKNDD